MAIMTTKNDILAFWRLPKWQNKPIQNLDQQKLQSSIAYGCVQDHAGSSVTVIYQQKVQLSYEDYIKSLLHSFLSGEVKTGHLNQSQKRHDNLIVYLGVKPDSCNITCADATIQLYIPHGIEKIINNNISTKELLHLCWQNCL